MSNLIIDLRRNLLFQVDTNTLLLEIIRLNSELSLERAKHKEEVTMLRYQIEKFEQDIAKEKIYDFRKLYFQCKNTQRRAHEMHIKETVLLKCKFLRDIGLCITSMTLSEYDENCEMFLKIVDKREIYSALTKKRTQRLKLEPNPEFKTPIIARMLYVKLRYLISDNAWRMLRKYAGDDFKSCPTVNALKTYQKQLNTIEVISIDKGAYVDVLETISARLRTVVNEYSIQATEELIVRISADSFNALKTKVLAITFTVINETDKCKAARGNYVLGLFKVFRENYEEVKRCYEHCFKNMSEEFSSININGTTFKVCVVYCCDMKMLLLTMGNLGATCKHPCHACLVDKDDLYSTKPSPKRSFPEKLGKYSHVRESLIPSFIPKENIIVDVLHMETAVGNMIINKVVKGLFELDNITQATKSFDPRIHLGLKRYLDFLKSLGIKYDFVTSADSPTLSGRTLSRNEVRKIIRNLNIEHLQPARINKIAFQELIDELDEIMLKLRTNLIKADDLQELTLKWIKLYRKLQHGTVVTPYMHTLVHHVPDMVRRFNGIHQFTLEGAEKKNDIIKNIIFRATNLKDPHIAPRVMKNLQQIDNLTQQLVANGEYFNDYNPTPRSVYDYKKNEEFHKINKIEADKDLSLDDENKVDENRDDANKDDDEVDCVENMDVVVDPVLDCQNERELLISNESVHLNVNGNEWLDNLHLIKFCQILKKQYPHINGLCDPRLLYNANYKPTVVHGKTILIFNTENPTMTQFGNHWIVVTNIGCQSDCWRIYDSAATKLQANKNIELLMQKLYDVDSADNECITIEVPSVQIQTNGYDCGLFALAFIHSLAENVDPSTVHYNQDKMRAHYNTSIQLGTIESFPKFPRKPLKIKSVFSTFQIKL